MLLALLVGLSGLAAYRPLRTAWLQKQPIERLAVWISRHPEDAPARLILARRYLASGRAAEAEQTLLPLVQTGTPTADAWLLLSQAQWDQGKPAEAYATLQIALPSLQDRAETHWRLGLLHELRGEERRAEESYRRALQIEPDHAESNLQLGRSALAHRHYAPAVDHLNRVIKSDSDNAEAHELLSLTYRNTGDLDRSVDHAKKATASAPDRWQGWRELGLSLQSQATPESIAAAQRAFRKAIQLAPRESDLHYQLGKIAAGRGEWKAAAEHLRAALEIHPLNRQPYPLLIQAMLRLGERREADAVRREYERVNEMDLSTAPLEYSIYAQPRNALLRVKLGELYLKYDRPDLAMQQVQEALELNPGLGAALALKKKIEALTE